MLVHIAKAEGSVSPTVVVDGTEFTGEPEDALFFLSNVHKNHIENQDLQITKYAIIWPSNHPMYDLNYMFFQQIPGEPCTFDYKGSCGHSILASIKVAMHWGWIPKATPGLRVRVYIENVNDSLVCEVDQASRDDIECTAHFISNPPLKLGATLPTGQVSDMLKTSFGKVEVSIIAAGNPYVFVESSALNINNEFDLFQAEEELFLKLQEIRKEAIKLLGWSQDSIFPKIALLDCFDQESISIRAISVPSWHPTLALTGAACLGVAASIKGTIVSKIAKKLDGYNCLKIRTKNGNTGVNSATTGEDLEDYLLYSSISDKKVQLICPINIGTEEEVLWKHSQKQKMILA
ncbi:PrpF domain-containing protein [Priestia sp. JNUCC 25]